MKGFNGRAFMIAAMTTVLFQAGFVASAAGGEDPLGRGFAEVVARTMPAVVYIASPEAVSPSHCLGSGVIVTSDGEIVTSHHVVDGVSDIRVLLSDNRELNARIVGTDPRTDLAVLKVDAADLPTVKLGQSSTVHVGDLALAIGDPFGLRQSVTMGIISATGRSNLGLLDFEDFVQTDAAINPGSSGGALINTRGELIGIITAGRRDFGGVGFAVPVDLVHSVMNQIVMHGRVIRGWLGATVQPLTAATGKAFGLTNDLHGALVADVSLGGPANRAGLVAGDIIFQVDGKPFRDDRELNFMIGMKAPEALVRLTVYRDGGEREFTATLMEEPKRPSTAGRLRVFHFSGPLGLSVQTVTAEISRALDLPAQTRGVIVTDVDSSSPAATAKIMEGDVILEINRVAVTSTEGFDAALLPANTQPVLLLIERAGIRMFVAVE